MYRSHKNNSSIISVSSWGRWLITRKKNYSVAARLWMNHFGENKKFPLNAFARREQQIWDGNEFDWHQVKTNCMCCCWFTHHWVAKMWIPIMRTTNTTVEHGIYGIWNVNYHMTELSHGKSNAFRWNFKLLFSLPSHAQPQLAQHKHTRRCMCPQTWNIDIIVSNYCIAWSDQLPSIDDAAIKYSQSIMRYRFVASPCTMNCWQTKCICEYISYQSDNQNGWRHGISSLSVAAFNAIILFFTQID